ncbi:aspartate aminotransferase family protein [Oceanispirochaeta crateris]|uniref:alanine--glyoxylate transaminase n=1 Tax=Oceanispirochaeta crateris TaxID=2518645 RepID=A0A5C1QH18_9SPIO|nr:aminotransferase class III-fold pyridoxal phosphate-dependent enzyme [Oceanispirochaeta crateris]QEN06618.1 aspartate aminotransferase family protein [Oceanispirochaeta crateris]
MALINSDYSGPEKILEKKKDFLMPCSYHFYKNPPQLVKGKGATLFDSKGKEYTDFFAGVSVMSCGHCNDLINKRVMDQLQTLQHTTSIYLTQPVVDLAEQLASVLPGNLRRSFFCNSGSEANEGAMLLARVYTGKKEFIALDGSLHGRTFLSSGANGIPMWRTDPFCDEVPVHFASSSEDVKKIMEEKGDRIAALLVEPIQGNGGIRPLPSDFFTSLRPMMKEKKILLICDEIQTGFARTGKMFAIEHYGVQPDILTGAKALGNGFPIGFFASTDAIASTFTKPSASTLGGNPVSCQAGLGVLEFIRKENLIEQARIKGEQLKKGLLEISRDCPFLGEPRGFGLMLGLPVSSYQDMDGAERCDLILEEMKDRGFLIGKNGLGRDVLAFQPPLVISSEMISLMLENLKKTVRK